MVVKLIKVEIKLFFMFFLLFSLFIQSTGWNEETRLSLTKAISEEGRLEIDSYANTTGDRIFYNSHFYSDKAPGASFFTVPVYSAWKRLYFNTFPRSFIDRNSGDDLFIDEDVEPPKLQKVYIYNNPGFFILTVMIFNTIFASSFFGAISIVIFYKILGFFDRDKKRRAFVSIIFGLATPLLFYSTVNQGNIIALFLLLSSFYVILRWKSNRMLFLSGSLITLSLFFDYISAIALPCFFLYVALKGKRYLVPFFIGSLLGLMPILVYNFSIFNNPLMFTLEHTVTEISQNLVSPGPIKCATPPFNLPTEYLLTPFGFISNINCALLIFPRLLFFPERGLFFYYPIFLLSFVGIWYMLKSKYRAEAILTLSIFVLFSISISFYGYWWAGSVFGPKYFLSVSPFLVLALMFFLKTCRKRILVYIFLLLLALSIFNTLIGLQPPLGWAITLDKEQPPNFFTTETYIQKLQAFEPIVNPHSYYIQLFLKDGPRSRILEDLIYDFSSVDIRDFKLIPVREIKLFTLSPFGILVLKVPFLVIPILFSIITLIWRKELFAFRIKTLSLGLFLLILIILLFLSRFEFKDVFYDKKWYPIHVNATHMMEERWMADKASMFFYWQKNEEVDLFFKVGTFYKPRNIRIEINNFSSDYLVTSYNDALITNANLKKGENIIHFESLVGCDTPALLINGSKDYRCLGFILHGFSVTGLSEYNIVFGKNWYPPEAHITWAYENPSVYVYSNQRAEAKLNLTLISYNRPREIDFYINHILFDTIRIEPHGINVITKTLPLRGENNLVEFINKDKCDIPALIEKSDDERCLSFGLINMNLVSPYELFEKSNLAFGPNWYEQEPDGRWMSNDASIFLFSEKEKEASLIFELASYHEKMGIEIYLNKNLILSKDIPASKIEITTPKVGLFEGENLIEIKASKKCYVPAEVEKTKDERCLSFKLFSLRIV